MRIERDFDALQMLMQSSSMGPLREKIRAAHESFKSYGSESAVKKWVACCRE